MLSPLVVDRIKSATRVSPDGEMTNDRRLGLNCLLTVSQSGLHSFSSSGSSRLSSMLRSGAGIRARKLVADLRWPLIETCRNRLKPGSDVKLTRMAESAVDTGVVIKSGVAIPGDDEPEVGTPLKKLAITPSERSATSIRRLVSDGMDDSHRPIDGDSAPGAIRETCSSVVCCWSKRGRVWGRREAEVMERDVRRVAEEINDK